jgi:hypothetical protein
MTSHKHCGLLVTFCVPLTVLQPHGPCPAKSPPRISRGVSASDKALKKKHPPGRGLGFPRETPPAPHLGGLVHGPTSIRLSNVPRPLARSVFLGSLAPLSGTRTQTSFFSGCGDRSCFLSVGCSVTLCLQVPGLVLPFCGLEAKSSVAGRPSLLVGTFRPSQFRGVGWVL